MNYIEKIKNLENFVIKTSCERFSHDLKNPSYKKLEKNKSEVVRDLFAKCVNKLNLDPNKPLYTLNGVKISEGFERIVVGDYGAYIEYDLSQVPEGMKYIIPQSQKYRLLPSYKKNVKYIWYSTEDNSCKIYWQLRGVTYADYKPKKFYISPYEVYQTHEG